MIEATETQGQAIDPAGQLLTVKDVGRMLKVHVRSVWRMAATGNLPAPLRLGEKTLRWRLADVLAYLDRLADQGNR